MAADQVPQADRDRIWQESAIRERFVDLILSLRAKGLDLPQRHTGEMN